MQTMNATQESTLPLTAEPPMSDQAGFTEIRVKGETIKVPSIRINNAPVIVTGKWLKQAVVKDEDLADPEIFRDPRVFIRGLKASGLGADVFTFAQKVPDTNVNFHYQVEWDNAAVVPITTYKEWLEKRVEYDVRKAIKKAAKLGVTCRIAEFNDTLVQGIVDIYAESPTRQGKAFWHYKKDFATVKDEAGTYLEKCDFVCAYFQDELIGFIKMAYVGNIAATIHVISKKKHFDKKATNVLLAKAVEVCVEKKVTHLTYGNYIYTDPTSSLTEFKRRNGFEKAMLPRYYIPLTAKGSLALKLGLHKGVTGMLPESVKLSLIKARSAIHKRLAGEETKETKETKPQNQSEANPQKSEKTEAAGKEVKAE
jgi:hypothetical protein